MNRGQALVPLLSICLSLSTSQARAQEDCSKFVVFDEASSYASEFYLKQTRDVFCRNTVSSRGQAVTAGYEAGIPVPVAEAFLKIDVAGHASSSDWSAWQDAFCKSQAGLEIASKVSLASTKTFGKNSSDVVAACINRPGLDAFLKFPSGKEIVDVVFHYEAWGNSTDVLVQTPTFNVGKAPAKCDAAQLKALATTRIKGKQERVVRCEWGGKESFSVAFSADQPPKYTGAFSISHSPATSESTRVWSWEPVSESALKQAGPNTGYNGCSVNSPVNRTQGSQLNLAYLANANVTAFSSHIAHPYTNLNDGWYENCKSWIADDGKPTGTITVDLGDEYEIQSVSLTNSYTMMDSPSGQPRSYRDRFISNATLQVKDSEGKVQYTTVLFPAPSGDPNLAGRREWTIPSATPGRVVEIVISASASGPPRIDEIEIWGARRKVWRVVPVQ